MCKLLPTRSSCATDISPRNSHSSKVQVPKFDARAAATCPTNRGALCMREKELELAQPVMSSKQLHARAHAHTHPRQSYQHQEIYQDSSQLSIPSLEPSGRHEHPFDCRHRPSFARQPKSQTQIAVTGRVGTYLWKPTIAFTALRRGRCLTRGLDDGGGRATSLGPLHCVR